MSGKRALLPCCGSFFGLFPGSLPTPSYSSPSPVFTSDSFLLFPPVLSLILFPFPHPRGTAATKRESGGLLLNKEEEERRLHTPDGY